MSGTPVQELPGERHIPRHRRARRIGVVTVAVMVVALLSATAYAGTMLMGSAPDPGRTASGARPEAPEDIAGSSAETAPSPSVTESKTGTPSSSSAPSPSTAGGGRASAGAGRPSPPRSASPRPGGGVKSYPDLEAEVLRLVNVERSRAGCDTTLTADARLAAAARAHSADMVARKYFSHTTPSGVGFATRITNAGYRWSAAAENIAAGQPDPAAVMRSWMNSPGHARNILNCRYRHLGVGVAFDSSRRPVWTQDFASPG